MDDGSPKLEVLFEIATGGSYEELSRLQELMGSAEMKAVLSAKKMEQTLGSLNFNGSSASVSAFAATTSAAFDKAEKSADRLTARLNDQTATFGMTKAAAAAYRADLVGATGAANDLRQAEAALNAVRDAEAQSTRAAAQAYQMFEAAARQGAAAMREVEAAQKAASVAAEAQAVREAAQAHLMFEAAARKGASAMREAEAAARAAATAEQSLANEAAQVRAALDPMYAGQQRFDAELERADRLLKANVISQREYGQAVQLARDALGAHAVAVAGSGGALDRLATGTGNATNSAVKNRMAMQGASYQIQDFVTQVSMGANPINAFAVQGAQLAGQFSNIEGKAGNVARFFMGPWGLAITAGLMLFGPFISKLLMGNDALDKAVDKLKKDATETEITAKAKERFGKSLEGVIAAIHDQEVALNKVVEAEKSAAEQANILAKANLAVAASKREETVALLENAIAQQKALNQAASNEQRYGKGDSASFGAQLQQGVVVGLEEQLAKATKAQVDAAKNVQMTRIGLAEEEAKRMTEPLERIKKIYDDQGEAAKAAARARVAAGGQVTSALSTELAGIERNRNAAIKAEQDRLQAIKDRIKGEARETATAASVAAMLRKTLPGVQITSTTGGKHVNGSDHYKDRAVDFVPAGGMSSMTKADVRAMVEKMGLQIRKNAGGVEQLFGPGDKGHSDHFHIAWEKGKVALDNYRASLRELTDEEVTEAQTKNLYALSDAYGASGGAALVALARVKATTDAIRQGGDVEASVARDVGLAIAQRVSDAAKSTATMRDQAAAQASVNASVAAGLVPADRAADLIKDQLDDLPLLAAIQAANDTKNAEGATRATKALEDQRAARIALTKAQADSRFDVAMQSGGEQLTELREELRLIGATDEARARALATLRATQEANRMIADGLDPAKAAAFVKLQGDIAAQAVINAQAQNAYNDELNFTADKWDLIARNIQAAGQGMADAFGSAGRAIGDLASIYAGYEADRARLDAKHTEDIRKAGGVQSQIDRVNQKYALESAGRQIAAFGDMAGAAKTFFKVHSTGYKVMEGAEKAFRAVQMAMAIKSMLEQIGLVGVHVATKVVGDATMIASDTARAGVEQSNSLATTAVKAVEAVINAIRSLPFPANLAAGAATAAAIVALGVGITGGFGGGKNNLPKANDGTGTVLGDSSAKSDSIKNAIDALKDVDTLTNTYARTMSASLKSIDSQIGGFAAQIVRAGNVNASEGVTEGFKPNAIGSILSHIPLIGGLLGSLFGSKTTVVGSGLYGAQQSVGSILNGGYDAQYYSDVQKKKKFFGITTGTSYSTKYSAADAGLENQFTLILKSFNDSIAAAAGPLGVATSEVQSRLNGFVVNIGKIDLTGLSGTEIQDKLSAVFGAAADGMANAAFPAIAQFQKVGEGAFETLVRVASTLEAVSASLDMLGSSAQGMSMAAKLGLADQFDSVSALTDAASAYFSTYYSKAEQAAAQTAQMTKVFGSLGLSMPATIVGFRQLVEAQDLNTAAGQTTYATLLKLAPAFADLQTSMEGVKSAADIASEKLDLQRQLLELQGDTAAIRALDLAKLDESNRGLQQQIWAVQDAKAAADAAKQLADAWTSVGDSILAEVNRIRGISDASGGTSFASLMGQFNAATVAARGGDQDAAKSLPGLSQALLTAAGNAATSRQELDRIQAQTAASLEATYGVINSIKLMGTPSTASTLSDAAAAAQAGQAPTAANDDMASEIRALREELAGMRADNNAGHATNASANAKTSRILEDVTAPSGGQAISVANGG